ncbi:MAG: glycosyltransferase family 4 protein [Pseudomonadota bacterium]
MKPLSLAVVRQRFARDGGAERFVARMLEALKGQDVRITLITRQWEKAEGADVVIVNPFYIGRLWRDWSFARAVCRELRQRSFDLVQSHERIACCDIYRAGDGVHREWLRQLARVRGFFGRLGLALNPYHCYTKRAEKKMFTSRRLRAVICNSKMVRDEIRSCFDVPESKLHVIYNGVDRNDFHPGVRQYRDATRQQHGIPDAATVYLFVGSGFERKGVAALLRALTRLPEQAYLLVVGRDRKLKHYMRLAQELGLDRRVIFAGRQADVLPYYGAADALVLPTLYDPFPNVIPEAMACGLPVIVSTKSGAAELIKQGVDGLVCDALDVDALAGHMRRLLAPEERNVLAAAARTKSRQFEIKDMSGRFQDLYRRILSHRVA